jgi:hypothetical protein
MFLLDVKEPSVVMLLLSAITALGAAVVWLALYIRKLHNRLNQVTIDKSDEVTEIAVKVTEVVQDVKATVANNTKAVEKVSELADELHHLILKGTQK